MPDKRISNLEFDSPDATEQALWARLADLPKDEPPPELRRSFYEHLEQATKRRWSQRLRDWLGFSGNGGWVTAAASAALGFVLATSFESPVSDDTDRLSVLEQNVALLNRELVLDRLQDDSVSTRLQGVRTAGSLVGQDREVVQALLARAIQDRAASVRSAAIEALAPQLQREDVGGALMQLLQAAPSPIVQLALVDLVLRNGSADQVRQLASLAEGGQLHPDLARHVHNATRSEAL